jgi:hypothetical protein
VGGLPVRESAIVEAQNTHFSLELFEMMSRRVNAVLALGTTDHALSAKSEIFRFRGNENFQPFCFGNSVIFNRSD